jgi:hypothetical protein
MTPFEKAADLVGRYLIMDTHDEDIKNFVGDSLISESKWDNGPVGYFIKTLEGTSYMLSKNDWIVKGVKGEFYPCKPDIFEATYEKI